MDSRGMLITVGCVAQCRVVALTPPPHPSLTSHLMLCGIVLCVVLVGGAHCQSNNASNATANTTNSSSISASATLSGSLSPSATPSVSVSPSPSQSPSLSPSGSPTWSLTGTRSRSRVNSSKAGPNRTRTRVRRNRTRTSSRTLPSVTPQRTPSRTNYTIGVVARRTRTVTPPLTTLPPTTAPAATPSPNASIAVPPVAVENEGLAVGLGIAFGLLLFLVLAGCWMCHRSHARRTRAAQLNDLERMDLTAAPRTAADAGRATVAPTVPRVPAAAHSPREMVNYEQPGDTPLPPPPPAE